MWLVLFNTEHVELMRRNSSHETTMPNLTQTSLISVMYTKSNLTCSHTVQSLVTERKEDEEGYFTVLHYLPIMTAENDLCLLMVIALKEKQIRQSSSFENLQDRKKNVISSLNAKHLANCLMYTIHGFMNMIIGELTFEQVHTSSAKSTLKRRLNVIIIVVVVIIII
jgi:hypothetical protein